MLNELERLSHIQLLRLGNDVVTVGGLLAAIALLCIAVHGAYHCGQMNLLKRLKS